VIPDLVKVPRSFSRGCTVILEIALANLHLETLSWRPTAKALAQIIYLAAHIKLRAQQNAPRMLHYHAA
jgi:uncharacterized membrane protein